MLYWKMITMLYWKMILGLHFFKNVLFLSGKMHFIIILYCAMKNVYYETLKNKFWSSFIKKWDFKTIFVLYRLVYYWGTAWNNFSFGRSLDEVNTYIENPSLPWQFSTTMEHGGRGRGRRSKERHSEIRSKSEPNIPEEIILGIFSVD